MVGLRLVPRSWVTAVHDKWITFKDNKVVFAIRARLPELNFLTLHYAYFIITVMISSVIFWGSSTPFRSVSYTDSLFLCMSAMTEAGLNTVNLSQLNTFQQFILFLLIILGSAIWVSAFVVIVRMKAFERKFEEKIKEMRENKLKSKAREEQSLPRTMSFFRPGQVRARTMTRSKEKEINESARESPVLTNISARSSEKSLGQDNTAQSTSQDSATKAMSATPNIDKQLDSIEGRLQISKQKPVLGLDTDLSPNANRGITFSPTLPNRSNTVLSRAVPGSNDKLRRPLIAIAGVGAAAGMSLRTAPKMLSTIPEGFRPPEHRRTDKWFFSENGYISRNAQINGLTFKERETLGGKEYMAIVFLAVIVPLYFFAWQFLGCLALGAYVNNNRADTARGNGLNPWWVGAFNAVSAFNNSGMSLLDANMTAFNTSYFMCLSMGLFILAGNTCYPIFLRGIVWTFWRVIPEKEYFQFEKDTLRFLLDFPRRCYTHLFPSRHTWYLLLTVFALNGIDWVAFPVLNIGNSKITYLSAGIEAVDGLFQAFAVRSGGFYVVPIPNIRISLQVLYTIMMYISVYPVTMSMRTSNVYEERSLGMYSEEDLDVGETPKSAKGSPGRLATLGRAMTNKFSTTTQARKRQDNSKFVRQQVRAQLSHDIWVVVFAVFLIMIVEASQFEAHPDWFSVFNVIFEVVSAYSCVGLTVGVPYNAFSFCGSWHVLSKLILCFVMLRGRHRGLPVAIDHAVQLPSSDGMYDAENEDVDRRLARQMTMASPLSRV